LSLKLKFDHSFVNYYCLMTYKPFSYLSQRSQIKPLCTYLTLFGLLCSCCHYLSAMYAFSFLHYRVKHTSFGDLILKSSVLFSFSPAAGFQISAGRTGMGRQPDRRRGELKKTRLSLPLSPSPVPT